jgi:hypothetical protein
MPIDTTLASRNHQGQKIHHIAFWAKGTQRSVATVSLRGGSFVADSVEANFAVL